MTIFDRLQKYFKETSEEQIKKDWDESKDFDNINSPTIEQFMLYNVGNHVCICDKTTQVNKINNKWICTECNRQIHQ